MIALLLRLALRASESAALRLDDIAWRQGTVTVRGKGNRIEQVPLPSDVGGPLARYLRGGRPAGTGHRQVFLALDAPHGPLTGAAVTSVAGRALRDAGISGEGAAHLLRHTAACGVLAAGGGLAEAASCCATPARSDRRLCQVRHHGAALDRAALAGRGALVNTDLRAAVPVYLAARRARGYRLDGHEQLLGSFLDSLESRGETRITVRAAVAFATPRPGPPRAGTLSGSQPCARSPATCTALTGRRRPSSGRAHPRRGPSAGFLTCIPVRTPPGSWPRQPYCPRRCWPLACGRSSG